MTVQSGGKQNGEGERLAGVGGARRGEGENVPEGQYGDGTNVFSSNLSIFCAIT